MHNDSCIHTYSQEKQVIQLYFRYWFPDNPKVLMIFVHGAGEHSGHYIELGTESFKRQFAFITPDLRGFGQSGGQRGHVGRFQDYLNDLDQLIAHFEKQFPEIPIYLLGHSLGGLIVIRYIQYFAKKVDGVILSSPALGIRSRIPYLFKKCAHMLSTLTPALSLELIKWNEALKQLSWLRKKLPNWTSELLNNPLSTIQYSPRWVSELLRNEVKALTEVNKYNVPTLCLYGLNDSVADSKHIEQFYEAIPSTDKASVFFSDGGHCPLYEHHKEEALEHIFEWVCSRL